MTTEAFRQDLETLVATGIREHGIGIVTADLQNLAADLLDQSDDVAFKKRAVKRFAERLGVQ